MHPSHISQLRRCRGVLLSFQGWGQDYSRGRLQVKAWTPRAMLHLLTPSGEDCPVAFHRAIQTDTRHQANIVSQSLILSPLVHLHYQDQGVEGKWLQYHALFHRQQMNRILLLNPHCRQIMAQLPKAQTHQHPCLNPVRPVQLLSGGHVYHGSVGLCRRRLRPFLQRIAVRHHRMLKHPPQHSTIQGSL